MTATIDVQLHGGPRDGDLVTVTCGALADLPHHLPGNAGYHFAQPAAGGDRRHIRYQWTYIRSGRRQPCGCHPTGCSRACPNRCRRAGA